jgi:hypothetical protein
MTTKSGAAPNEDSLIVFHIDYDSTVMLVSSEAWDNDTINIGRPWWICGDYNDQGGEVNRQVLWPNGGETLYVGDTVMLRICTKDAIDYPPGKVPPELHLQGGLVFARLSDYWVENNKIYWTVQDTVYDGFTKEKISAVSDSCLLRAIEYGTIYDYDFSDSFFSIKYRE